MSIIKLQGTSTVVDNVTIEPISNIGKLYVNEDVTLNEIDSIRYAAYQPQVSTKSIPFLDTDSEYSYFNKLVDEVKTLHLQADEYNTSAHYDSLQILNKYNNVNTPDGSITLVDLLGIVKSTYASLNDTIQYNNGVYKKIVLDSEEMILLAMGQIKALGDGMLETEAGLKITMDNIKMYVDSKYTDLNGSIENFNSLLITTEGLLLSAVENKLDAYGNYIYKNYASLTVFNDRIATLVGREDFDEHGRMISRNTSSIVQLATEISLRVTGEQFNEMGELVRKAESSITMLEGSITSKVSLEEYERFQVGNNQWLDLVAKHETKIEQLPDAIKMSVKSSYIDGLIEGLNDVKGTNKVLDDYLHTVGTSLSDVLKAYETMEIKSNALSEDYSGIYGLALVQQASIDILEGEIVLKASSLYVNPETGDITTLASMLDILSGKIGMLVAVNGTIRGGMVISAINSNTDTDETGAKITIAGSKLNVNAYTTFGPGYNPGVKNTCFMQEPKPPYQKGDVWIKDEEYYTSTVDKLEGSFSIKDWTKSLKYTDDSLARTMTKVYRQTSDPQGLWLTDAAKEDHLDDQWIAIDPEISTTTAVLKRYVKNLINGSYSYDWELDQTIIDAGRIITNKVFAERIYAAGATIGGFEIYKGTQTVNGVEVEYDYLRTTEQPNPWASDLNQGIWLGKDQGIYKFFVGNSKEYIVFDGNNLIISGYTRLGNNNDGVTIGDLGVLNKYFKIVNPGLENEYIQVLGHMCATGNIAAYRGNSDVFPDKIWQAIPDAGYGAAGNRGLVRIGDGLSIDSFGVLSISGGVGTQSLKFENKILTLSGGGGFVDLSSFASSWSDILNKPDSFTPAVHSHTFDSITGKPSTFTPSVHDHSFASLTGKPTTLVGYGITDSLLRHYSGVADLNSIGVEGVFTSIINPANASNQLWMAGIELHLDHNASYRHQLAMSSNGAIMYRYSSPPNGWNDWRLVWDNGNFDPASKANKTGDAAVEFSASKLTLANLNLSTVLVSDSSNGIVSSSVTSDKLLKLAQMFDLVQPASGTSYIKANYSLMSVGGLTAYAQTTSNEGLWGQMPFATTTTRGGIIVGQGLDINNGILSVNSSYGTQTISLVGNTLNLSGNGGNADLSTIVPTWANISGKPTTFEANGFKALTSAGFYFVNDLHGGGGDTAGMRLLTKTVGTENITLELYVTNDATDTINFSTPAINGVTVNSYPVWHTGNLTGDQGGHYHSADRSWGNITGKPTELWGYGVTDGVLGVLLEDTTTFKNSFTQDIFGTTNAGFFLREIRTSMNAPGALIPGYASGLAWKGADTYGSLMVAYHTAFIRVSGGNGTNPVWTADLWHSLNFNPATKAELNGSSSAYFCTQELRVYGDSKIWDKVAFQGYDSWLRINEGKAFTDGIYCGTGILRTDGNFQVGASGAYFGVIANNTYINNYLNVLGGEGDLITLKYDYLANGSIKAKRSYAGTYVNAWSLGNTTKEVNHVYLSTHQDGSLIFQTNDSDKLEITSGGIINVYATTSDANYAKIDFIRRTGGSFGAIHCLDTTWQGGNLYYSSGAININATYGVTLGPWDNPTVIVDAVNKRVGINRLSGGGALEVQGRVHIGDYTNGTASIAAHGGNAYFGCNVAENGIFIDVNGGLTTSDLLATGTIKGTGIGVIKSDGASPLGVSLWNGYETGGDGVINYGLWMGITSTFGTHGYVWGGRYATYFRMGGDANWGWIFQNNNYGNVFSINTSGNAYANGVISANTYYARTNGGLCFQPGDDCGIYDVNIVDTLGVYSLRDNTVGGIQLGSGGVKLYGTGGSLYAYGNVIATGGLTSYTASDAYLKENVVNIKGTALKFLDKLRPVTFDWNDIAKSLNPSFEDNEHSASFIAQEWETVFPWATHTIWGKYKSIDSAILFPYLVAGIAELNDKIDTVEDILNKRIKMLEQEVEQLKLMI